MVAFVSEVLSPSPGVASALRRDLESAAGKELRSAVSPPFCLLLQLFTCNLHYIKCLLAAFVLYFTSYLFN